MFVREKGYSWLRKSITRLSTTRIADGEVDDPTVYALFKCPRGKRLIVDHVKIHSNNADLSGANDINFGGGAAAATPVWKDAADISSMSTAQMELKLVPAGAVIIIDGDDSTVANRTFGCEVVAGSTGASAYTIDVFGYLISS